MNYTLIQFKSSISLFPLLLWLWARTSRCCCITKQNHIITGNQHNTRHKTEPSPPIRPPIFYFIRLLRILSARLRDNVGFSVCVCIISSSSSISFALCCGSACVLCVRDFLFSCNFPKKKLRLVENQRASVF